MNEFLSAGETIDDSDAESKPVIWPYIVIGSVFVVLAVSMIIMMRPKKLPPKPVVGLPPAPSAPANFVPGSIPGLPSINITIQDK